MKQPFSALCLAGLLGLSMAAEAAVVPWDNMAPVARAGGVYNLAIGSDLELDGSASSDPNIADGDVLFFHWDANNDGVFGELLRVTPLVTWAQASAWWHPVEGGSTTVTLRVTDSAGASSFDSARIQFVAALPPTSTVPEPASMGLVLAGALAAAAAMRKARRR